MNRIKLLRSTQTPKMSQEKLAKLVGVGRTTVTMWENGLNEPDNSTLVKLARIFGVTADYLLGCSDQKETPPIDIDEGRLDQELIQRLSLLTPEEQEKVDAFVQGLLAARSAETFHQV